MSRHHLARGVVVAALLVAGCTGESTEDTTAVEPATTVTVPTSDQERDQDRDRTMDRDRIRQVVVDVLDACGSQDRDRLRDQLRTELREQLDGAASRYGAGTTFELVDATITIDGDRATVRATVRIRERAREEVTATFEWHLEYTDAWRLSELPPCLVDGASATTAGDPEPDRDQDRDQDREDRDDGADAEVAPISGPTA